MPLPEARRTQLDTLVQRMLDQGESDETIQRSVDEFKALYGDYPKPSREEPETFAGGFWPEAAPVLADAAITGGLAATGPGLARGVGRLVSGVGRPALKKGLEMVGGVLGSKLTGHPFVGWRAGSGLAQTLLNRLEGSAAQGAIRTTTPAAKAMQAGPKIRAATRAVPELVEDTPDYLASFARKKPLTPSQLRELRSPAGRAQRRESLLSSMESSSLSAPVRGMEAANLPRLAGKTQHGSELYLQFEGPGVTADQVRSMFPGANIEVTRFSKYGSMRPDQSQFKIFVSDEQGRLSSTAAERLSQQIGKDFTDWSGNPFRNVTPTK